MTSDLGSDSEIAPEPQAVFRIHPEIVYAAFDDRVLLHHLNLGHTLTLNRTAGLMLELIEDRCSAEEIREIIQRAYSGPAEDIQRDVDQTLRYLLDRGVLLPRLG